MKLTEIAEELRWRGLLQDLSDPELFKKLRAGDGFYCGFDPTAPSLHLGNLQQIIVGLHLARAGLRPIMLFGGATGAIGDPSGRRAERQLLDQSTIDANVERHRTKINEIFTRHDLKADYVNNLDWTKGVDIITFLREVGKHFSVNYMLAKEWVRARLEAEGISFTEFCYILLQSYDFLHLYQHNNCKLQFGGSDQWGNITGGLELIRRKIGGEAYAFSVSLILDSEGKKLGKSEGGGGVWIDAEHMSPYRFHQYFLNCADADVVGLLKRLTFLPHEQIVELERATQNSPDKREAQRVLADTLCTLVHGATATEEALRAARVLFGGSLDGISEQSLVQIFAEVPSSSVPRKELETLAIADLFVKAGLSSSKSEARKLVQNGGAYLNNERVEDAQLKLAGHAALTKSIMILRSGKKSYHLVRVT